MKKILVVDDDIDICNLLQRFLKKNDFDVATAYSGNSALSLLSNQPFDLVLCDYRLSDMDGRELITKIKEINPTAAIIIITGYSDVKVAVNVIRMGAYDYVTKPLLPDEILLTINKALEKAGKEKDAEPVPAEISTPKHIQAERAKNTSYAPDEEFVLGESRLMKDLYKQLQLVAATNYSVVIFGESGTGKELVAKTIHKLSNRSNKPFVAMDCGALSKELALSELFGHEKGAFTGAMNTKIGHFEMANGGTLFLDEVSNLSYETQMALLRVIQERKLKRIGSTKEIDIDVRIIVASNDNLKESSLRGNFREDLYHRLNQFGLNIPPLRDRGRDIVAYAKHFLHSANNELGKHVSGFTREAEDILLQYKWPGNLRELKNVINRAALLTDSEYIAPTALPQELIYSHKFELGDSGSIPVQHYGYVAGHSYEQRPPVEANHSLKAAAAEAEMETIMRVLREVNFNKTKAAQILGIDRKTLYNKMKNHR